MLPYVIFLPFALLASIVFVNRSLDSDSFILDIFSSISISGVLATAVSIYLVTKIARYNLWQTKITSLGSVLMLLVLSHFLVGFIFSGLTFMGYRVSDLNSSDQVEEEIRMEEPYSRTPLAPFDQRVTFGIFLAAALIFSVTSLLALPVTGFFFAMAGLLTWYMGKQAVENRGDVT